MNKLFNSIIEASSKGYKYLAHYYLVLLVKSQLMVHTTKPTIEDARKVESLVTLSEEEINKIIRLWVKKHKGD